MYKTVRNLTVLGVGLSVSAVVGWLLFKETQRDRSPAAVRVRSAMRPPEPAEPTEIRLPLESLEAEPESAAAAPTDDLTRIVDIGPRFAEALHKIGITTYEQLAAQTPADLAQRLGDHVAVRAQRIRDKDWIGQAKRLARES